MKNNSSVFFLIFLFLISCKKETLEQFRIIKETEISEFLIAWQTVEVKEQPFHLSKTIVKLNKGDLVKAVHQITVKYSVKNDKQVEEVADGYKEIHFKKYKGYVRYYTLDYLTLDNSMAVCIDEKDDCKNDIQSSLDFHEFKDTLSYQYTDHEGRYLRIRTDQSATEEPFPVVFLTGGASYVEFKASDLQKTKAHTFQFKTAERFLEMEAEKQSPQKYRIHILKYEGPEPEEFKNALNGFKVEQGY